MICGISDCAASIADTFTMPEKIGPRITYGSSSIAFCICERAVPGLVCVSYCLSSILRPSSPPLALISSIAIKAPSRKLVDDTAPAPDSSPMKAKFTGPDCANAPVPSVAANAAASMVFFIHSSLRFSLKSLASPYGSTLLRLTALGDNGIERRADALARGLETGEQAKRVDRLVDAQLAAGHDAAAGGARSLQQRRPQRRIDRVGDKHVFAQEGSWHGGVEGRQHADRRAVDDAACAGERLRGTVAHAGGHARAG